MNMYEALKNRQALGAADTAVNKTGMPCPPAAYSLTREMDTETRLSAVGLVLCEKFGMLLSTWQRHKRGFSFFKWVAKYNKNKGMVYPTFVLTPSGIALRVIGWALIVFRPKDFSWVLWTFGLREELEICLSCAIGTIVKPLWSPLILEHSRLRQTLPGAILSSLGTTRSWPRHLPTWLVCTWTTSSFYLISSLLSCSLGFPS